MGFDVWVLGHCLIGWVGILGRWWCRGCGGGWLSFGPTMFVAVVGGGVCGRNGPAVFVEDFEFLFLFSFVKVFGFGICWRSSDCDCSLWRLICRCCCRWLFVEVDCDFSLMCWNLFNII